MREVGDHGLFRVVWALMGDVMVWCTIGSDLVYERFLGLYDRGS